MTTLLRRWLAAALLIAMAAGAAQAGPPQAMVGEPAPPLRLKDLDGRMHELAEWQGEVVLLNFWATWCGPCQYEIRDLVRLQERHGGLGLQVVGVGVDEAEKLANVHRSLGINYPVLVAGPLNSNLLERWGNGQGTVPYNVVVDREGRVRYLQRGALDEEIFADVVAPLLEETSAALPSPAVE